MQSLLSLLVVSLAASVGYISSSQSSSERFEKLVEVVPVEELRAQEVLTDLENGDHTFHAVSERGSSITSYLRVSPALKAESSESPERIFASAVTF